MGECVSKCKEQAGMYLLDHKIGVKVARRKHAYKVEVHIHRIVGMDNQSMDLQSKCKQSSLWPCS